MFEQIYFSLKNNFNAKKVNAVCYKFELNMESSFCFQQHGLKDVLCSQELTNAFYYVGIKLLFYLYKNSPVFIDLKISI